MKQKLKLKRKYRVIVLVILLLIIIAGGVYISIELFSINKDKNTYNEVLKFFNTTDTNENEEDAKVKKINELHDQYKNVVGWLEIPDSDISYPLVQGSNNSYYLSHNYKNESSSSGSIFVDSSADIETSDNLLIYGHRNKYGLMFAKLTDYAHKDFYESHKVINLTTLKEDSKYEVIAVFYSRVYYQEEENVFRYYYFINASNEEEFNDYVKNAKDASIYKIDTEVEYGDQLITLSTCEFRKNGENGRFVVVAKKIN